MAPEAEECGAGAGAGAGGGRRVLPAGAAPARAWLEHEEPERSPGESRRLLPPAKSLQDGVTLGVHTKYPLHAADPGAFNKTKFQKRKEKLIEVLKPPYFILTMIIVIVCIHLFVSREQRESLEWSPGSWRLQPWRLLTYGLAHATTSHLALNCLVGLAVGWRLEREQGWWRVVVLWAGGVVGGALGAGAFQPDVRVVGASAAVYALLTAHLPNVCLRFGHIPLWWFRPLSVVVLGASEGCWALLRGESVGDHVAWSAHALGAAVGVPLAFIVFKGENEKKPAIIAARVVSVVALVAGAALAGVHYAWSEHDGT